MRFLFAAALFFVSHFICAQPIITNNCNPEPGDIIEHAWLSGDQPVPEEGENVVWDYSGYEIGGDITYNFGQPSNFSNHEMYPEADVAWNNFGTDQFYEQTDDSFFARLGHTRSGGTYHDYDVSSKYCYFPFQYGDSVEQYYTGQVYNGVTTELFDVDKYDLVEAVGYGTLILPNQTFEDVLLVKKFNQDSLYLDGVLDSFYSGTTWYWFHDDYRSFIATYHASWIVQTLDIRVGQATAIDEDTYKSEFKCWPNPASNRLFIETALYSGTPIAVSIFNSAGRLVSKHSLNSGIEELDVSHLPAGVYSISLLDERRVVTQKFLIH